MCVYIFYIKTMSCRQSLDLVLNVNELKPSLTKEIYNSY